ncbi:Tex family protein [Marinomonas epiphytica]
MTSISRILCNEFSIANQYSDNIIQLLESGASVPFIARYRKESSGGMSDVDLRAFSERWQYLTDLNDRKKAIIELIKNSPQVTQNLFNKIENAQTKAELEDLYAPFKKTKSTKADVARKQGLMPLAQALWAGQCQDTETAIKQWCLYQKVSVPIKEVLIGVEELIFERLLIDSDLLKKGRQLIQQEGLITSRVLRGKKEAGEKFKDYFDYQEKVSKVPAHRLLALFRGKKESVLKISIHYQDSDLFPSPLVTPYLTKLFNENAALSPISNVQRKYLNLAWQKKLHGKIESDVLSSLKDKAEEGAIQVFKDNLVDLLMAAPAGAHRVMGVDPGFRNGVKLAMIDEQGRVLEHGVIYPHPPQNRYDEASKKLAGWIQQYKITWLAVGNGTASRETESLIKETIRQYGLSCQAVVVSEAGASVYSASQVAIDEFPDLDVTIRGAISIARRFQDPLAELVKIDPQAIGVGQYQHDVKSNHLSRALANVVEDCVNRVGVDINLASAPLLSYVAGLTDRLAQNIVDYRNQKGAITSRSELLKVKGVGAKCFEQCAGFLRILNGKETLDQSSVHPESYPVVKQMAQQMGLSIQALIGNPNVISQLKQQGASQLGIGNYTFNDILDELAKPGRDPRPEFQYAAFDQSVQSISDLQEEMILEGVVTNVAAFGAFVDIGVHQDGLVHISQLSNRFVKDPRDIVRVGQVIKVQVLEVDEKRKRISLKAIAQ